METAMMPAASGNEHSEPLPRLQQVAAEQFEIMRRE